MSRLTNDLAYQILEAAGIGGWDLDVATLELAWTPIAFDIHELPPGPPPSLAAAIDFYRADARPVVARALEEAIATGAPWDLELPLITAKGRARWIRTCGRAERRDGATVRLFGSLEDVTSRRELTERAERLSVVATQMTNAVVMTGADGRTEWINDAFSRLTGFTLEDMLGRSPGHLLQGPDTDPATVRHMRDRLAAGEGFDVEIVNYTRERAPYWMKVTCTPLRNDAGGLAGFIAVESDVTARKAAEANAARETQERARAEALLRDVLEALPSAVTAYDAEERLILTNRAYAEMFPIAAEAAVPGQTLSGLVRYGVDHGQYPEAGETPEEQERWIEALLASHRGNGASRILMLPGGRFIQARERRSDSGNLVCVRSDMTALKQAEAELRSQAECDSLTGIANRRAFLAALTRHLTADRPGGAVMLFDVDHFKTINDTLGHDVGDALLIETAARLREHTRTGDVPARLGGDEFAVVLPGLSDGSILTRRIAAIQAALAQPVAIGRRNVTVTTSAGVARFPRDGDTPDRLLKAADLALYEAKRGGRDRWCAFHPAMADGATAAGAF